MKGFRADAIRVGRFSIVGVLNTLVDLSVFLVLVSAVGMPLVPANLVAFVAALSNSYVLNRSWTFRDREAPASAGSIAQFVIFCTAGAGLATGVLWLLTQFGLPILVGKLLSILASMSWNYLTMQHFVFGPRR